MYKSLRKSTTKKDEEKKRCLILCSWTLNDADKKLKKVTLVVYFFPPSSLRKLFELVLQDKAAERNPCHRLSSETKEDIYSTSARHEKLFIFIPLCAR